MSRKIICLCSGGLDSFALVHIFKNLNYKIKILYIDYGHLSSRMEYKSVQAIAKLLDIYEVLEIDIKNYGNLFLNNLTIKEKLLNDFFPGRNLLLLAIAASIAYELQIQEISIGIINSERIFTDCTPLFFSKLEDLFYLIFNFHLGIQTPLENCSKLDIIRYLKKYELPLNLTYSCQKGEKNHCMKCPSCIERFKAIETLKNL